jgi:hypothetical protein
MKLRNLVLIFAAGILLGALVVAFFGDPRTVFSPDTPKDLGSPEPSPAPITREPHTARIAVPPPPRTSETRPPEAG